MKPAVEITRRAPVARAADQVTKVNSLRPQLPRRVALGLLAAPLLTPAWAGALEITKGDITAIKERDHIWDTTISWQDRNPFESAENLSLADRRKRLQVVRGALEVVPGHVSRGERFQAMSAITGRAGTARYDMDKLLELLPRKERLEGVRLQDRVMQDMEQVLLALRQGREERQAEQLSKDFIKHYDEMLAFLDAQEAVKRYMA